MPLKLTNVPMPLVCVVMLVVSFVSASCRLVTLALFKSFADITFTSTGEFSALW